MIPVFYRSMKIAIPIWNDRISPVFDAARTVLLVNFDCGEETSRSKVAFMDDDIYRRAERLSELDTNVLICGAISRPLENELIQRGIQVVSRVCGEVDRVLSAYCLGENISDHFAMPGCCQKHRMRRRCRGESQWQKGNLG